jgi:hypothetical protein
MGLAGLMPVGKGPLGQSGRALCYPGVGSAGFGPESGPERESPRFNSKEVEVMSGFEPLNNAFAERSLTTWVHHRRAEVKKKRWIFNQVTPFPERVGFT